MSFDVNKDGAILKGLTDSQIRYLDEVDGKSDGSIKDSVFNIAREKLAEYTNAGKTDEQGKSEMWEDLKGIINKLKFSQTETTTRNIDTDGDGKDDEQETITSKYNSEGYRVRHSYERSSGNFTLMHEYNKDGLRTYTREERENGVVLVHRYEYNDNGKLVRCAVDKEGVGLIGEVKFELDADGNVLSGTDISYDGQGNVLRTADALEYADYDAYMMQPIKYYEEE